ncbi:hypothetical protein K505DRAFT_412465 [Melanomma pulvis-pyrius CBS 109.77]|uniref:DUF7580 domain-containing protein n=1 Tax=Melanomma pulvis-pyrius CBS 109.77 TaxID=1314802 RepID=A0A6A6XZN0_9PLEO|nr:hypothetical protein K505DRAFT_412465 [Melanomma pulvis-pyrius CBS 109.77]
MSGLEIAGVILGSIPLLIVALEHYMEGVDTVRRYVKYKHELASLHRRLVVEQNMFINTCDLLLSGLVPLNEVSLYLQNPGGAAWKKPEVDASLKARLQRSYKSYFDTIQDLNDAVEEFKKRLKLDPDLGKVQNPDIGVFEQEKRRLALSLRKSTYDGLLTRIEKDNFVLSRLLEQNLWLEQKRVSLPNRKTLSDLKAIQNYARSVYSILCWKCGCKDSHSANLRLEPRIEEEIGKPEDEELRFRVVFSYGQGKPPSHSPPWSWEEADVSLEKELPTPPVKTLAPKTRSKKKPRSLLRSVLGLRKRTKEPKQGLQATIIPLVENSTPKITPELGPIEDLCRAIVKIQQPQRNLCLGFLVDELTQRKHCIYPLQESSTDKASWSVLSLNNILVERASFVSPFTRLDRLRLGVTLASSVLQLHETPWLRKDWGKQDILFIQQRPEPAYIYKHPFVSRVVQEDQMLTAWGNNESEASSSTNTLRAVRNRTLFALGVLLIELYYGKALEELREPTDTSGPVADWNTADRLVDTLYSEAGFRYASAVRRCIRCDFDCRESDLSDDKFKEAVYTGVVMLLEEDLKAFIG